jgi:hypothetical protein
MNDIDGSPRSEDREHAGLIKADGVRGAVLDLKAETERMSTHVRQVTKRLIYLGAIERRMRASGIGDAETVLGEDVQNSTGIVEEFEGLVTCVGNCRGDLQVIQSGNLDAGGRRLDGQAGGSRDGDRRGDEGDEGSAEVRGEHHDGGSEGGRRDDSKESLGLNEPDLSSPSALMCHG